MKRFLVASGLIAALALSAVAAQSATAKHHHPGCGPGCTSGSCSIKGTSAAAVTKPGPAAVSAANGSKCPVSDPSACPSSCPRTSAGVSAKPATAKPIAVTIAAR